tara:strand:- start:2059 stop:5718 length:3660 start_codon:yes stop_codon:yes gene_type:complete
MSFAYKKLKPSDLQSTPYVANKLYDIPSSSYDDLGVKLYVGEYIPIDNLEFDPINDNKDIDGNYRRLIFDSVRHLYYQNYVTASSLEIPYPENTNQFWHSSSYDNYLQNTLASGSFDATIRQMPYFTSSFFNYDESGSAIYDESTYFSENSAKIRVISIPQDIFGNGIQPDTFELSGSTYLIKDDGLGNLWDYSDLDDFYASSKYSDPEAEYFDSGSKYYVGNIFYSHGIAVITNIDYLCFASTNPVARNDYFKILNTQRTKTLPILDNDFDDCSGVDTSSVKILPDPDYSFPDTSINQFGELVVTPNKLGSTPGNYQINYSVDNTLGLPSNTASIFLELTALPLSSSVVSVTQSCFESTTSSSVTFSIDQGVPPYSYSLNVEGFSDYIPLTTSSNDLYQPVISASILPTRSLVLSVKDAQESVYTQSFNTSLPAIPASIFASPTAQNNISVGKIIISGSGVGTISASLTSSFSNSLELPNTFTSLTEGTYSVYLQDGNLCTTSSQIVVGTIQPVTSSYTITNDLCFSGSDGSFIQKRNEPIQGGRLPLTWSWSGSTGYTTNSIDAYNVFSGSYTLEIFDADGATSSFSYDLLSPSIITYTASISYSSSLSSSISIQNLFGGTPPYNITASVADTDYLLTSSNGGNLSIKLNAEGLTSGSASIFIEDTSDCNLISASVLNYFVSGTSPSSSFVGTTSSLEYYSRNWEISQSFCENSTSSSTPTTRKLNFYTYEDTGSEWVKVLIYSGSETAIQIDTSGSATGSYIWNTNDTLYIDVETGSSDSFYLRREFSGSSDISGSPANLIGNEVSNSVLLTGSLRMDDYNSNLDVSLAFGIGYQSMSLHLTASKVNASVENTNINFKFDKQIPLAKIRDNFTGSASNLATTGSDGSGSNFIARSNEFTDIIYGNTGSFIGPNTDLFRANYAFGNIINTISGSNVEYTDGSIWSGSVSASYFGDENAYYFTQRTDKVWLLTADIDSIGFLEAYSYTSASFFDSDPLSPRTNLDPYTHKDYTIYAGSQQMVNELMYTMIIHEDENTTMPLPAGLGGGEIFSRKLENIQDVNRVYYLFTSPNISPAFASGSYAVTVSNPGAGNRYYIDSVLQPTLTLRRGIISTLDQSSGTTSGHPIRLSTTENGTHNGGTEYTGSNNGVFYSGTAGTDGLLSMTLPLDAPDTLYYYCVNHSDMGGQINVYDSSSIQADLDNRSIALGKYFIDNVIYG